MCPVEENFVYTKVMKIDFLVLKLILCSRIIFNYDVLSSLLIFPFGLLHLDYLGD